MLAKHHVENQSFNETDADHFTSRTPPLGSAVRCEKLMEKLKQQVAAEIAARGLVSVMNDTKWRELQNAVRTELAFCPPYQLKAVLNVPYPEQFESDVDYLGDWRNLYPYFPIEWIRVRPRFRDHPVWRRTEAPEVRSVESEFLAILHRCHIPYRRDEGSIWVFGYASSTADLVCSCTQTGAANGTGGSPHP